jgi:hypothetical protein
MAKATLDLPSGAKVTIEGTPEEVQELLEYYSSIESKVKPPPKATKITSKKKDKQPDLEPDLAKIINLIKSCDEAESIEERILDRTSEVNRVLLPLYIVHEYLDNTFGLTATEISSITSDLGVRVFRQNANRSLTGSGKGYVVSDSLRKRGVATHYKLNRRGAKYMKSVIQGEEDEE